MRGHLLKAAWIGAVVALAQPAHAAAGGGIDRAAWHADLDALRDALTAGYANLEHAVERGLDLPAAERRARARIDAAADVHQARFALTRFVEMFGDGHLELNWPAPSPSAPTPAPSGAAAASVPPGICASLPAAGRPDDGAIAARLPGYEALTAPGAENAAGLITIDGRRVGVLRIPLFMATRADCDEALQSVPSAEPGCDEDCRDDAMRRTDRLFAARLAARVEALRAAGAELLLVDIARNGGGSDSAIAAARMVGGADLPAPEVARLRSPAMLSDVIGDRAALAARSADAPAELRAQLDAWDRGLAAAAEEARRPCDRSPLWRGDTIACSALVRGPFRAGGLSTFALPATLQASAWAEWVDWTVRYDLAPGLWQGPLLVLVDGDTASAAELFAAMLQDGGRAVIVGAPTLGSGCGWTLPPQPVALPRSGAILRMPDCARFRRDGSNEVDGIQPDVLVGFKRWDTPAQRARRLAPRLGAALAEALARGR
jgi:hypothetical protein